MGISMKRVFYLFFASDSTLSQLINNFERKTSESEIPGTHRTDGKVHKMNKYATRATVKSRRLHSAVS